MLLKTGTNSFFYLINQFYFLSWTMKFILQNEGVK